MKKMSLFKKSLLIYSGVALLLGFIFLIYIFITLKDYEGMQSGNFLRNTITSLSDDELKGYLTENNLEESLLEEYKKQINSKDLKFAKKDEDTFTVSLNNRILFLVETKVIREGTKLGLFSYEEREATKIIPSLERGLIYYDVTIPSNYTLLVDGKEFDGTSKEEKYEGLDFMYENDSMPYMVTYEVNNLSKEVDLEVKDFNDKKVDLKQNKYKYTVEDYIINVDTYEDAKKYLDGEIDVWEVAHNWSLFLSRDLKGNRWGFTTITNYLIPKTSMYQMAYNWAHNIDIMFISAHTLDNPTWTNEKLSNFKVYGKDAFSCEVYTEKNMTLKNGQKQVDKMHDYLYFIKNNNEWKLINIKSVVEDKNE